MNDIKADFDTFDSVILTSGLSTTATAWTTAYLLTYTLYDSWHCHCQAMCHVWLFWLEFQSDLRGQGHV